MVYIRYPWFMKAKVNEKKEAITLRRLGYSYSEIQKRVAVSQSSLSLWLRDVFLSKKVKEILREKKVLGQIKGAKARRRQRLDKLETTISKVVRLYDNYKDSDLFLVGIFLYWAEGTKQSVKNPSQGVVFANSDPRMIKFFLFWLEKYFDVKIQPGSVKLSMYLHRNAPKKKIKNLWMHYLGVNSDLFGKPVLKKTLFDRNRDSNYLGVLRISVKRSTHLNREFATWVETICREILPDRLMVGRQTLNLKI